MLIGQTTEKHTDSSMSDTIAAKRVQDRGSSYIARKDCEAVAKFMEVGLQDRTDAVWRHVQYGLYVKRLYTRALEV